MAFEHKSLNEITEADLRQLIAEKVSENERLEYKKDVNYSTDEAKRELAKDFAAFANRSGGHYVIGIDEREGDPYELVGVEWMNLDQKAREIVETVRANTHPPLPIIQFKDIPLACGKRCVVFYVPRSWQAPHAVNRAQNKDYYSFPIRMVSETTYLNIDEIRTAFVGSEALGDRIRSFRADRLNKIIAGETPMDLYNVLPQTRNLNNPLPITVLHVVPVSAFDLGHRIDLSPILSFHHLGSQKRWNFDGVLVESPPHRVQVPSHPSYYQFFHNGCAEALMMQQENGDEGVRYLYTSFELFVLDTLEQILKTVKQLNIATPLFIMLSLINVRGHTIRGMGELSAEQAILNMLGSVPGQVRPIDRNLLIVPEAFLDSPDADVKRALKPLVDQVWQATGHPNSITGTLA